MVIEARPTVQKRTGAYYTPPVLARFLTRWAVRLSTDRVLDPACGEAIFLESAVGRLRDLGAQTVVEQVLGYELDERAAVEARRIEPSATVNVGNFFDARADERGYQAVIGNPPYVRYHYFSGDVRAKALASAREAGVFLSQLTSSWAPFLVHASTFLAPEGRLAFVLPNELLSTDYASKIRDFLQKRFKSVDVLTFEQRVFPGALVDAVLVLAEGSGPGEVRIHRLSGLQALNDFDPDIEPITFTDKWTYGLIDASVSLALNEAASQMTPLGRIASVDIGLVTGANSFFVLTDGQAKALRLSHKDLRRTIARGHQLPGHQLTERDWELQRLQDKPVWLFYPDSASGSAGEYILAGQGRGVHTSYKCSVRSPWWSLKLNEPPDLILTYMSNRAPRLVANKVGVLTTNLLHNVRIISPTVDPATLALGWHNSATMLSCELAGRAYGGGVLKLETREAERVMVPVLPAEVEAELKRMRSAIDPLLIGGLPEQVAELIDPIVLHHVDQRTRKELRGAWLDLRARRKRRSVPADK